MEVNSNSKDSNHPKVHIVNVLDLVPWEKVFTPLDKKSLKISIVQNYMQYSLAPNLKYLLCVGKNNCYICNMNDL